MEAAELLAPAAQFGAAGLIALMWLSERRAAAERERKLDEAHARLMEQREQLSALLEVVGENTRAMAALEETQRSLVRIINEFDGREAA